jgi:hypothetical protein
MFNLFDAYVLSILNYNCEVGALIKQKIFPANTKAKYKER